VLVALPLLPLPPLLPAAPLLPSGSANPVSVALHPLLHAGWTSWPTCCWRQVPPQPWCAAPLLHASGCRRAAAAGVLAHWCRPCGGAFSNCLAQLCVADSFIYRYVGLEGVCSCLCLENLQICPPAGLPTAGLPQFPQPRWPCCSFATQAHSIAEVEDFVGIAFRRPWHRWPA